MKKRFSVFSAFCVVFFFAFAAFMTWYIPSVSSVRSKIVQTQRDLETSRGREDKQHAEYNKAVEELPVVRAELQEKEPLAEESLNAVEKLKSRRKELRAEKKALESESSPDESAEGTEGKEESSDDR